MTTQSLISGQSFGTSTNVGNNKFSINPATLADGTTAYVINAQSTVTVRDMDDMRQEVRIWYTTTMRTVASTDAFNKLAHTARYLDLRVGSKHQGLINIQDGFLEPKTGAKLHLWVEAPTLKNAATLDVDVVEIPS